MTAKRVLFVNIIEMLSKNRKKIFASMLSKLDKTKLKFAWKSEKKNLKRFQFLRLERSKIHSSKTSICFYLLLNQVPMLLWHLAWFFPLEAYFSKSKLDGGLICSQQFWKDKELQFCGFERWIVQLNHPYIKTIEFCYVSLCKGVH